MECACLDCQEECVVTAGSARARSTIKTDAVDAEWNYRMIPVRALSTATLFAAILAGLSAHQATHGAIIGVVTDLSGAVLPGVTVVATKDAEQRTSTTDGSGRYRIDKLLPGPYQLEADLSGFLRQRVENVVVEAGREVAWSVSLPLPRDQSLPVESFIDPLTGAEARDCGRHTANPTIGNMRRRSWLVRKPARRRR
jgi:hypothetical protein